MIKLRNKSFGRFHYFVVTLVDTYNVGWHYIWPAYYYNPLVKSDFPSSIDSRITLVDLEYSSGFLETFFINTSTKLLKPRKCIY